MGKSLLSRFLTHGVRGTAHTCNVALELAWSKVRGRCRQWRFSAGV